MPIYCYQCGKCGHAEEEYQGIHDEPVAQCPGCKTEGCYHRVPTYTHTDMKEFHKPIEMHSIGLAHPDEIRDFQRRNPDVQISTDPDHPLYGVPIAHTRKEKLQILDREGYVERK